MQLYDLLSMANGAISQAQGAPAINPVMPGGVNIAPEQARSSQPYAGTNIPAQSFYSKPPANWDAIKGGIFAGESGGDYDALFGFSNRPGGRYAGTKLTDMTLDQALQFAAPSGDYGQWVKGQVGRVATPMGAYQVVGTTLRQAKEGLGLTGNEKMTPELQDAIGQWIYHQQGTGAWEGYRGPNANFQTRLADRASTQTMRGGQGNDRLSTQGAPMGLLDSFQQQEEPQRFGDKLRASASDGSLWDGLALAANSLRRRPDAGLAQMISQRQESREGAKRLNRTVEWMRGNGFGDLAGAVESGALSPQQAIAMVMQQPEDNRTDDMREWEVAQSGGYGGTFADWMGKTGGAEMSAKEKEIERIMRTWGVDEKTAVGVVDGIVVVSPNPLTGKPELVNKLTGDTMSGQTAQQPTQAPGGEISVESLPRVEGARDAFGVEGIARDAVNAVAGAAGLPAPFGTTQDAINYFDSFGESILRDIAQAYPRMPAESRMKKLEGLVPKAGGFQGWDNARSKLGTLRNEFETDMGIARQSLGQSLSPDVRQEIELKIIGLQAAIAKVDQALGALGGAGTTSGNAGTTSNGLKWSVK